MVYFPRLDSSLDREDTPIKNPPQTPDCGEFCGSRDYSKVEILAFLNGRIKAWSEYPLSERITVNLAQIQRD
jgi:hypothetical protein